MRHAGLLPTVPIAAGSMGPVLAIVSSARGGAWIDSTGFDVADVRTGMLPTEVRGTIARHFGVAPGAVRTSVMPGPAAHGSHISLLDYELMGEAVLVGFQPQSLSLDVPVPADDTQLQQNDASGTIVIPFGQDRRAADEWCSTIRRLST